MNNQNVSADLDFRIKNNQNVPTESEFQIKNNQNFSADSEFWLCLDGPQHSRFQQQPWNSWSCQKVTPVLPKTMMSWISQKKLDHTNDEVHCCWARAGRLFCVLTECWHLAHCAFSHLVGHRKCILLVTCAITRQMKFQFKCTNTTDKWKNCCRPAEKKTFKNVFFCLLVLYPQI